LDRVRASALMNFVFVSFEVACRILPLGMLLCPCCGPKEFCFCFF